MPLPLLDKDDPRLLCAPRSSQHTLLETLKCLFTLNKAILLDTYRVEAIEYELVTVLPRQAVLGQ